MRFLSLILLVGCPYVGEEQYNEEIADIDGDSVRDSRFDGPDCDSSNPNIGDCDVDGDGFLAPPFGDDCDDEDGAVHPAAAEQCNGFDDDCDGLIDSVQTIAAENLATFYMDLDGDTYGGEPVLGCPDSPPQGTVERAGDCDDNNAEVQPGASEFCDELDRNCDGEIHLAAVDQEMWFPDEDGDGFGSGLLSTMACDAPVNTGPPGDCNDADPNISPNAAEVCNNLDDNCDGNVDDEDGSVINVTVWRLDSDGDGWGAAGSQVQQCASPGEDYVDIDAMDCDDADPNITESRTWYADDDSDGFGDASSTLLSCARPPDHVLIVGDCDDANPSINPSSPEVCNGVDDNCVDGIDEVGGQVWFEDGDGDGVGTDDVLVFACELPAGFSPIPGDCDDDDSSVSPLRTEQCNDVDDDCNGLVDDNLQVQEFYLDLDGDGFGREGVSVLDSCGADLAGFTDRFGDCDDSDPTVWRSITIFDGTESPLQEVLDETCDGGTVLFRGDQSIGPVVLPRRSLLWARADANDDATLRPTPEGDVTDDPIIVIPSEASLRIVGLDVRQSDPGCEDDNRVPINVFAVSANAELTLEGMDFADLRLNQALVRVQSGGTLRVLGSSHHDIRTGINGLFSGALSSTISVEHAEFRDLQGRTGRPAILSVSRPFWVNLDTVHVENVTNADNLLFLNRFPSQTALLRRITALNTPMVVSGVNHPFELIGGRFVGVGHPRVLDPCDGEIEEGAVQPSLQVEGAAPVSIENTEFIGSGTIKIARSPTDISPDTIVSNCAFYGVEDVPILQPPTTAGSERGELFFIDNLVIDAPVADADRAISLCEGNRSWSTVAGQDPPSFSDGSCLESTDDTSLTGLEVVYLPSSPVVGADEPGAILYPHLDFCDPQVDLTAGLLGGLHADFSWADDADMDQMADGWERFWFGSTASCDEADILAYQAQEVPLNPDTPRADCTSAPSCGPL